jgi:AhpD family alkylhydroperoxidase
MLSGAQTMSTVKMVEYEAASPEVRAIYDEVMQSKGITFVPNFWKTVATHPPMLAQLWSEIQQVMAPGALDPLTKELIALAVSTTNGCEYCINSHTAGAIAKGMTPQMHSELMAVIGFFNKTNRLSDGYQVEADVKPKID